MRPLLWRIGADSFKVPQKSRKTLIMASQLIPCPVCARELSPAATSCPQCGQPMTPVLTPAQARNVQFDATWKRIRRLAFIVVTLLALPTLSVPTLVAKFTSPALAGQAEFAALWQVFALTAPLSVALALLTLIVCRSGSSWWNAIWDDGLPMLGLVLLGLAALFAAPAFLIGLMLPNPPVNIPETFSLIWNMDLDIGLAVWAVKPAYFIYIVLAKYWVAYGPWPFTSALMVGIFIGWSLDKLAQYKDVLAERLVQSVTQTFHS
jgi:hypothetical protein